MTRSFEVPVGVSARHIHLSAEDLAILFGEGHELKAIRDLKQVGEFASEEKVKLVGPKGELSLRVLGPLRSKTQVELAFTDAMKLGLKVPIKQSGDLDGAASVEIVGPKGSVTRDCAIAAWRHIHLPPEEAEQINVQDNQKVQVVLEGDRALTFDNVIVRVKDTFRNEFHIDTDEANAAGIANNTTARIIL